MTSSIISLENISYIRDSIPLLKNISWQVNANENWVLLGPNGCGKTTLMKMIAGWMFPSEGRLNVLGHQFGEANLTELRSRIGWVTGMLAEEVPGQLTAREIVFAGSMGMLGLYGDPNEEQIAIAESCMTLMDMAEFADRKFNLLSQGERMRTLIARALATRPCMLILDEPCSGLDPVSREDFLYTINELAKSEKAPPILFVTHHIDEIVPAMNHILALRHGEIVIQGTKEDVLTAENLQKIFLTQFHVFQENDRYYGRPISNKSFGA